MTIPRNEVTEVQRIPLDLIDSSPFNVRQMIDVDSLTRSIDSVGQIVPLRLRPAGDRYQVRTGERKYLALKRAGATHADAIIVEGSDEEVISEQWDENEEREAYTDYERALKLRQVLDALGLTQTELAERLGKKQNWVSRHLSILKLDGIIPRGIIQKVSERHARAILAAPDEDRQDLGKYVELYLEEKGEILPATVIEDYARELTNTREFEKNRRRFLYEVEPVLGPSEESVAEFARPLPEEYIKEQDLGWVFDAEAYGNEAGFLTKIATLTAEELEFCIAHETRPLNLQRLNEEIDRRELDQPKRLLLNEPPTTSAQILTTINQIVGEPVEDLPTKLMEEHGLTEQEADAALQAYRETYPDIWDRGYSKEPEEPMTVEQYVVDVLTHNSEVEPAELAKVTAEMYGVSEAYAQGLIDRTTGKRRGRKPRDPYEAKSPKTICPLCGRANAEKNRILMVLEEHQATQPGITLLSWLREVLA